MPATRFRPARALRVLAQACLAVLFTLPIAPATFAQGAWTGDFAIPSFDGDVRACAIHGGDYVVAGDFQWAGGTRVANVARWSGTGWEQVGQGLQGVVHQLASWDASLLAAQRGFDADAPVVRYDGTDWRPLGSGIYGEAIALLVDGGTVYAAGQLLLAGQTNGYRVARWSGGAWEPVGGTFDGQVRALAVWRGELYAAGEFLNGDIGYVSRIARFDGSHWVSLGGGLNAGTPYIADLAVFQDRLIAGGWFESAGGVAADCIAAWDGAAWQALPGTPDDCIVRDLEVDGGRLLVAGTLQETANWIAGLASFDGQTWYVEPTRPSWTVDDVAAGGGALLAVGGIGGLDTGFAPEITSESVRNVVVRDPAWRPLEAWQPTMRGLRGSMWSAIYALHVHAGELFAGGYIAQVADPPQWRDANGVARWDGDRWRPLAGELRGDVRALTSWNGELVAGGGIATGDGSSDVARWDGAQWHSIGGSIGYLSALAVWQGALVAAGSLRALDAPLEGPGVAVMIHQDQGWAPLGGLQLAESGVANTLAAYGGDLYVGGRGLLVVGEGVYSLVRWDGMRWSGVPGAPQAAVTALKAMQDGLWVGLYSPGSFGPRSVWRWSGTQWTDFGLESWLVDELAFADGHVIAAGSGPLGTGNATLARLVDGEWEPIADSPNRPVRALASLGRDLFVGGEFTRAGNRQAEAVARFSFDAVPPGPRPKLALAAGPNPASDLVNFRFTLTRPGRVRLTLHDVSGALVARPLDERLDAGTIERSWRPRDGGVTRSGIYFARLETPEGEVTTRIVVVE